MSGGISAATVIAAIGTAYGIYSGEQQASASKKAASKAQANAAASAKAGEEATNRANSKKPNTAAILDQMLMAGKTGTAGTTLTGPTGVDPNQLSLGRSTLLGG